MMASSLTSKSKKTLEIQTKLLEKDLKLVAGDLNDRVKRLENIVYSIQKTLIKLVEKHGI